MDSVVNSEKERFRRDARSIRRAFVVGLDETTRNSLQASLGERTAALLKGMRVVTAYVPMGHEIDPQACLDTLATGAVFGLPWFANRDAPMQFREATNSLEPGPFGTMQPAASAALLYPDALLVPLIAADERGNRIGQGKGHFDRALAALRAERAVLAIGLAWDVQVFESLPADSWDERLDAVVTPTRIIRR